MNKCVCKHIRALQACGLASRRLVPLVARVRSLSAAAAAEVARV